MLHHDLDVALPERPRSRDELLLAEGEDLSTDDSREAGPVDERDGRDDGGKAWADRPRDDHRDQDQRETPDHLHEAVDDGVDPAAVVAGHHTGDGADDENGERRQQSDTHGDPDAFEQPAEHVTP